MRTIFRQADNNEIKGYDLSYFTKDSAGISLWLGQAKLGKKAYCKNGINEDLIEKYSPQMPCGELKKGTAIFASLGLI